jgi:hypothetical protein
VSPCDDSGLSFERDMCPPMLVDTAESDGLLAR